MALRFRPVPDGQLPDAGPDGAVQLHASTVVIGGRALVLAGAAGAGKSQTALSLMAYGATLLADDITWFTATSHALIAHCPPTLAGRIEARGLGLLRVPAAAPAPVSVVVDLDQIETDRLPPARHITCLGHRLAFLHKPDSPRFPEMIRAYMLYGGPDDGPAPSC